MMYSCLTYIYTPNSMLGFFGTGWVFRQLIIIPLINDDSNNNNNNRNTVGKHKQMINMYSTKNEIKVNNTQKPIYLE